MITNKYARTISQTDSSSTRTEDERSEMCIVVSYAFAYNEFNAHSWNTTNLKYLYFGADCWTSSLKELTIKGL